MFSKTCEYAIKATLYVASKSKLGVSISLKEIASASNTPQAFTGKILQTLVRNKILSSTKGRGGGFYLESSRLKSIKLKHIVNAIDGEHSYAGCVLGLDQCNDAKPCPVHQKFLPIKEKLLVMLEQTLLDDLTELLDEGSVYLKR